MPNKTDADANIRIGRMLQTARESRNVTQKDMAVAVDISQNHISAIERGQNKASIAMLLGYCDRLDMTPNEILGFTDKDILLELKEVIHQMNTAEQQKLCEIARILKS